MNKKTSKKYEKSEKTLHTNENSSQKKKYSAPLIVSIALLGVLATSMTVGFAVSVNMLNERSISLENLYERSFFDLVENINNVEIKMSKLLVSNDSNYSQKLLSEIHDNSSDAQNNISYLPLSVNGISDTISFINKLGGYTLTMSRTLAKNSEKMTETDIETMEKLYTEIKSVKAKLNEISMQILNGYNILNASKKVENEYNDFTTTIQSIKATDEEYPSMIYDGPFSDSELNREIKGLNFAEKTKEECEALVKTYFSKEKIRQVNYMGEADGKFQTYDFVVDLENENSLRVQLTKKGGKLLTVSSYTKGLQKNFTLGNAKTIAEEFASHLSLENMKSVWSCVLGNNAYINLAPVLDGVIIYPDLIKVKVDLGTGIIIGYEAKSFYTNNIDRKIGKPTFDAVTARNNLNPKFEVLSQKLSLAPIDFGKEVLCFEFKCLFNDSEYYVYVNAQTGKEENILKVIDTQDGNKLM